MCLRNEYQWMIEGAYKVQSEIARRAPWLAGSRWSLDVSLKLT